MLNLKRRGSFFAWMIAITTISLLQGCKPESYTLTKATEVDKQASFKGDVYRYLCNHMAYPKTAIEQKIEGYATVKFIVDEKGSVVGQTIIRSTNDLFSAAALQLVDQMPAWQPAIKNGRPVAVELYLPVRFLLDKVGMNVVSLTDPEPTAGMHDVSAGLHVDVTAKLTKADARAREFETAKTERSF